MGWVDAMTLRTDYWLMKQRWTRIGRFAEPAAFLPDDDPIHWRGPSWPRDDIFKTHPGDPVIVWDALKHVAWEANISLGRVTWETWLDDETGEEVSGWGLWMVRVAAAPVAVAKGSEAYEAIVGPRNASGNPTHGRDTLREPLPEPIGVELWSITRRRGRRGRLRRLARHRDRGGSMTDPRGRRGRITVPALPTTRSHRRIARLGVGALHPACRAAYYEHAKPCGRCSWLLGLENEGSAYIDAHVDDDEGEVGA